MSEKAVKHLDVGLLIPIPIERHICLNMCPTHYRFFTLCLVHFTRSAHIETTFTVDNRSAHLTLYNERTKPTRLKIPAMWHLSHQVDIIRVKTSTKERLRLAPRARHAVETAAIARYPTLANRLSSLTSTPRTSEHSTTRRKTRNSIEIQNPKIWTRQGAIYAFAQGTVDELSA